MRLQVLTDAAAWEAISEEWEALVLTQLQATPFQLPVWLRTWWAHFGSGSLQVLTFRERDALVGIMALFRHEWNGNHQLTLVGTGLSDWTDPVLSPGALSLLKRYLEENQSWTVLDWQDLASDSPLANLCGMERREDTPCSEVRFTGTFDGFWAERGKDLRRNVRRYGDRARSAGRVEFGVTSSADPQILDDLVRLHGARWQQQGETGMIVANNAEVFLRNVAQQFSAKGLLRIFYMRMDGELVAIILGVLLHGNYFAYMSAFDPKKERYGFGSMLLYEAFRYCFDNGIFVWKFLRGQEAYKASWGAQLVPKIRLYRER